MVLNITRETCFLSPSFKNLSIGPSQYCEPSFGQPPSATVCEPCYWSSAYSVCSAKLHQAILVSEPCYWSLAYPISIAIGPHLILRALLLVINLQYARYDSTALLLVLRLFWGFCDWSSGYFSEPCYWSLAYPVSTAIGPHHIL